MKVSVQDNACKVLEKIAADPRVQGKWMPTEAWAILFQRLSIDSFTQKTISKILRIFSDGCRGWELPKQLCIKTFSYTIFRDGAERTQTCHFYLIYSEKKKQEEALLNVTGGREQWQKRHDDALAYCRSIPPDPIIELQKLADARVEMVNARWREQERKELAVRQAEEEEKAIAAQDQRVRALDMARVAWQEKYDEEFPTELFQKLSLSTM